MDNQKQPLPEQRQSFVALDSDSKRQSSSDLLDDNTLAKKTNLVISKGIDSKSLTSQENHNTSVENNEFRATDQSKGEEFKHRNVRDDKGHQMNTHESLAIAHCITGGKTKLSNADEDAASNATALGPLHSVVEKSAATSSDEHAGIGKLQENLGRENMEMRQSQQQNSVRCLDDKNFSLSDGESLTSGIFEIFRPDRITDRDANDQSIGISPNTDDHEQEFYKVQNSGEKDFRAIPIAGCKPWNSLPSKISAALDDWKLSVGDTLLVRATENQEGLAKVSDIRHLGSECYLVVLAWYYTRDEIKDELQGRRKIPKQRQAHLDAQWPPDAPFSHMLSSNQTINMWDTIRGKASPEVMAKICPDKFYVTTDSIRKICKAGHPDYKWMKELLDLKPFA